MESLHPQSSKNTPQLLTQTQKWSKSSKSDFWIIWPTHLPPQEFTIGKSDQVQPSSLQLCFLLLALPNSGWGFARVSADLPAVAAQLPQPQRCKTRRMANETHHAMEATAASKIVTTWQQSTTISDLGKDPTTSGRLFLFIFLLHETDGYDATCIMFSPASSFCSKTCASKSHYTSQWSSSQWPCGQRQMPQFLGRWVSFSFGFGGWSFSFESASSSTCFRNKHWQDGTPQEAWKRWNVGFPTRTFFAAFTGPLKSKLRNGSKLLWFLSSVQCFHMIIHG